LTGSVSTGPATTAITPVVVKKFGGSSVADVDRIRAVADHVVATHRGGKRVVVVVSAMGKTTDELVRLAARAATMPDRREMDMLLTAGERISMALLAMAIRDRGVPATSLTGSQSGIITNDRQGNAEVVEVRPYRVEDALEAGHVVIVAGFQGVSYRREVTTLGRGGSDTTAVALAAALGAEACEIYSDVDGVYSADPRVVVSAQRLAELDHDQMLDLARAGARVLAADAVAYARAKKIALFVRAADGRPGETLVRRDAPGLQPVLCGVGMREDAWLWRFDITADAELRLDGLLDGAQPSVVLHSRVSADGASRHVLLFARAPGDKDGDAHRQLAAKIDGLVGEEGRDGHTLVTAVLRGTRADGAARRVFESIARTHSAAATIVHGRCCSALIPGESADEFGRVVHDALLGEAQ